MIPGNKTSCFLTCVLLVYLVLSSPLSLEGDAACGLNPYRRPDNESWLTRPTSAAQKKWIKKQNLLLDFKPITNYPDPGQIANTGTLLKPCTKEFNCINQENMSTGIRTYEPCKFVHLFNSNPFICSFVRSSIHWFIHLLVRWYICSFVGMFFRSLVHSFIRTIQWCMIHPCTIVPYIPMIWTKAWVTRPEQPNGVKDEVHSYIAIVVALKKSTWPYLRNTVVEWIPIFATHGEECRDCTF